MSDNNLEFVIEDSVLKECRGNAENAFVPFGVTVIGKAAFVNSGVKSLVLPNTVLNIENRVFHYNKSLAEITIPYSVKEMGFYAFYNCSSLKAVHIQDVAAWCNINFHDSHSNPLLYARNLYLNKELVKTITIPNEISSIKDFAFTHCESIENTIITDNVKSIGTGAFTSCIFLTDVTIGNGVANIKNSAFLNCRSLKSIIIPDNVINIEDLAFSCCSSLSEVVFKGELENINRAVFFKSDNIEKITVCSENMKRRLLESIDIPEGCNIIVDTSLSKSNNIRLGSEYLSDADKDTFNYNKEPDDIEINEGDVL